MLNRSDYEATSLRVCSLSDDHRTMSEAQDAAYLALSRIVHRSDGERARVAAGNLAKWCERQGLTALATHWRDNASGRI